MLIKLQKRINKHQPDPFGWNPLRLEPSVAAILADVRARGDEAVVYYAAKFDGAKFRAREIRVKETDLAAAGCTAINAAHDYEDRMSGIHITTNIEKAERYITENS